MSEILVISPFLVTSLYAVYEIWKSPRARGWSIAVIGSAGLMICCLFWLEPVLDFLHIAAGAFNFDRAAYVIAIRSIVFLLHAILLGMLVWKSEPDIPYGDIEA